MNIYLTIFPGSEQLVCRKRDIACSDKQLPQKNNKADHSACYDIYGKYSHRCGKVMIYRNQL